MDPKLVKEGLEEPSPPAESNGKPYAGMANYVPRDPPNNPVARGLERFFKGARDGALRLMHTTHHGAAP
jgi:hypothetical protein